MLHLLGFQETRADCLQFSTLAKNVSCSHRSPELSLQRLCQSYCLREFLLARLAIGDGDFHCSLRCLVHFNHQLPGVNTVDYCWKSQEKCCWVSKRFCRLVFLSAVSLSQSRHFRWSRYFLLLQYLVVSTPDHQHFN